LVAVGDGRLGDHGGGSTAGACAGAGAASRGDSHGSCAGAGASAVFARLPLLERRLDLRRAESPVELRRSEPVSVSERAELYEEPLWLKASSSSSTGGIAVGAQQTVKSEGQTSKARSFFFFFFSSMRGASSHLRRLLLRLAAR
jgi:hypothetical protein